jgi:O-acetyl-ADP-ribose deacetylase (regulator of RNase III)
MKLIRTRTYCDICESCSGSCPCCVRYIDMYEYRKGNLFESECEALVNTVNCIGVMGAGLAHAFKKKFPQMNVDYIKCCKEGLRPGTMHVWENPAGKPKFIINFPTKDDLSPSKLGYITDGLDALKQVVIAKKIVTIAIPALGCGLGGLSWGVVKTHIENFADDLPETTKVFIYEPL